MPEKKYLAIRNWSKFQDTKDKHGRSLNGRHQVYIRDYTEKETDSLYASLTVHQRYMIDGCRRLQGKHGCNVRNDYMWVVRQLDIAREERHSCVRALGQLIKRGLLVPTNEQFNVPELPELPSEVRSQKQKSESASVSASVSASGSGSGSGSAADETDSDTEKINPTDQPEQITYWEGTLIPDRDLDEDPRKVKAVLDWMQTIPYWKGKLLRSVKAFRTAEAQYDKFYAKLPEGKKPHQQSPEPEEEPLTVAKAFEIEGAEEQTTVSRAWDIEE